MKNTFSVGYGRKQLSGPLPINTWNSTADVYRDPLYLTCIAFSDGENTALVMSADVMKVDGTAFEECARRLGEKLGIERKSIMIHAIHSHYAPTITRTCSWAETFFDAALAATESALADLSPGKLSETKRTAMLRQIKANGLISLAFCDFCKLLRMLLAGHFSMHI